MLRYMWKQYRELSYLLDLRTVLWYLEELGREVVLVLEHGQSLLQSIIGDKSRQLAELLVLAYQFAFVISFQEPSVLWHRDSVQIVEYLLVLV